METNHDCDKTLLAIINEICNFLTKLRKKESVTVVEVLQKLRQLIAIFNNHQTAVETTLPKFVSGSTTDLLSTIPLLENNINSEISFSQFTVCSPDQPITEVAEVVAFLVSTVSDKGIEVNGFCRQQTASSIIPTQVNPDYSQSIITIDITSDDSMSNSADDTMITPVKVLEPLVGREQTIQNKSIEQKELDDRQDTRPDEIFPQESAYDQPLVDVTIMEEIPVSKSPVSDTEQQLDVTTVSNVIVDSYESTFKSIGPTATSNSLSSSSVIESTKLKSTTMTTVIESIPNVITPKLFKMNIQTSKSSIAQAKPIQQSGVPWLRLNETSFQRQAYTRCEVKLMYYTNVVNFCPYFPTLSKEEEYIGSDKVDIKLNEIKIVITFIKPSPNQSGTYVLDLSNKQVEIKKEINFHFVTCPGRPGEPLRVTNMKTNQCRLSWMKPSYDGNSPIVMYNIFYQDKTSGSRSWKWSNNTTELSATVLNLKPSNKYLFKVTAVNVLRSSQPLISADEYETLSKGDPPTPPRGVTIVERVNNQVRLTWIEPKRDYGLPVTQYSIEYKDISSPYWSTCSQTKGDQHTTMVDDLTYAHYYKFRVKAVNNAGVSTASEETKVIEIKDYEKPVFDSEISDKTVRVGSTIEYEVKFYGKPIPIIKWSLCGRELKPSKRVKIVTSDQKSRLTIRPVERTDHGELKVTIINKHNKATTNAKLIVCDKPPVPRGPLKIIDNNNGSVNVEWEKPTGADMFGLIQYELEMCDTRTNKWYGKGVAKPTQSNLKSENLMDGKSYTFRVRAIYKNGLRSEYLYTTESIKIKTYNDRSEDRTKKSHQEQSKPELVLTVIEKVVRGKIGKSVQLLCVVSTKEQLQISWNKDGKEVIGTPRVRLVRKGSNIMLNISNLDDNDSGIYTLTIKTDGKHASDEFTLIVESSKELFVRLIPLTPKLIEMARINASKISKSVMKNELKFVTITCKRRVDEITSSTTTAETTTDEEIASEEEISPPKRRKIINI